MLSLLRFNGWALGNSKKKLVHLKKTRTFQNVVIPTNPLVLGIASGRQWWGLPWRQRRWQ
jgi:hypothetical protein